MSIKVKNFSKSTKKNRKGFVSVPRDKYEEFLVWQKINSARRFKPTKEELQIIERGEKEIAAGNYLNWEEVKELKNGLENPRNQFRRKRSKQVAR